MKLRLFFGSFIIFSALFLCVGSQSADEWKPRHDLVSHTGVMNLAELPPPGEIFFSGPNSISDQPAWLENLKAWRSNRRTLLRYNGSVYERPELEWTQHIFSQVQVLIWDRLLYDPEKHEYTVDRFLSDTAARIGPIDAVLVWHVYPNLGIDDRNQFDLLCDLPGGVWGIRHLVEEFHRHGVKVFLPFLMWDTGTRPPNSDKATALAQLMKEIGADGVNFDTLETVPLQFQQASDAIGYPLAIEPQFQPRDNSIAWSTLSWNDWVTWEGQQYPFVPMVSKNKWMEPRHTVNVTDRFTRDKTDSMQHAFFNGQGYSTLENLWGFWYGDTPRDAEAVLRFTHIERAIFDYLRSLDWEPHTPMMQSGVFASRFPTANGTLWTIVNRNEFDVDGPQLRVAHSSGTRYYDLWHGSELQPAITHGVAVLNFDIESLGYGAILATSKSPDQAHILDLTQFMAQRSHLLLSSYSKEWQAVPQALVEIAPTKVATSAPPGMIRIPEGDFDFAVKGIEIEGGNDPGVDVQYPWENQPRRTHHHRLHLHSFYIDWTPVTNAEFKKFVDRTNYRPADDHNFVHDWQSGTYPNGWKNKPVTWVSIEDARAYCESIEKRLPHEWEWQYAAQSTDGRTYPWGDEWKPETVPAVDHGPQMRPLSDVGAFPSDASPFGILDLVGDVSQWTDEYRDPHTRAAILRGGASYQPVGSIWYFPQTYRLDEHEKYLLMSPGRDRAATIGFRCVKDAK